MIEYRQLSDIKSNDVNNSCLESMNQEVEIRDCLSHASEVHNEQVFILDSNVDAFTGHLMKRTSN